MAKIEDWHIGLSRLVCGQALHGGYQNINELIQAGAQLIADSVPHAPASTAPKEVIEKYARDLRMHNETRPLANTREKQEETLRAILTRFLSEARGDVEPVAWMYDFNNGDEDDSFLAFTDDADIPGHIGKITKKTPLYKTTDRICEWRIQPFPDGSGSMTFRTCLGKDHLGTLCGNPDGFQDRAKYCENCGGKIVASALKGGGK